MIISDDAIAKAGIVLLLLFVIYVIVAAYIVYIKEGRG